MVLYHTPADLSSIERSTSSLEIEAYWRALGHGGAVPLRSAIRARDIPLGLLPNIGICSLTVEEDQVRCEYRLAGTRFRDLVGMELTGAEYEALVLSGKFQERAEILRCVICMPVGVWLVSQVTFGGEYSCLYQSTVLPLRSRESSNSDQFLDLIECDVPVAVRGMPAELSGKVLKWRWIDIGAGQPVSWRVGT